VRLENHRGVECDYAIHRYDLRRAALFFCAPVIVISGDDRLSTRARNFPPCANARWRANLLRRSRGDDAPALFAALRAKVDDPVRGFDNVEVVFDDEKRRPRRRSTCGNAVRSFCMVVEVEARRRFVEDIQDTLVCLRCEMRGKLEGVAPRRPESVVADCPRRR